MPGEKKKKSSKPNEKSSLASDPDASPVQIVKKTSSKDKKRKLSTQMAQGDESGKEEAKVEKDVEKKKKKKKKDASGQEAESKEESPKKVKKEKKVKSKKEKSSKEHSNSQGDPSLASTDSSSISKDLVASYLQEHEITVTADTPLDPFLEFQQFPTALPDMCKSFTKPSPIQATSWPYILKGRDVIGIAETGSGKTLAFGLPATLIPSNKASTAPTVLIVAPTRELAIQIHDTCSQLDQNFKSVCVYGGVPKENQRRLLKQKVHFCIGTPGRLLDLIEEGVVNLKEVQYLVLDEADRMLDQGFERDIRTILSLTPKERQTLMFSATWPEGVRKLASEFLRNPVTIQIGSRDEFSSNSNVTQIVEVLEDQYQKDGKLGDLLRKYHSSRKNRILIFALYKKEAMRLEQMVSRWGYKAVGIHGDKTQDARMEALGQFKSGASPLLIATDVAARGLDIPGVEYVINYTFPLTVEDYIHRIGRTGRAGKTGIAHTFFTTLDKAHSGGLINVLKSSNQQVPENLMKFGTTVKKKEHKVYGAFFKEVDPNVKGKKIVFD